MPEENEKHDNPPPQPESLPPEPTDEEYDEYIGKLLDTIEQQQSQLDELRSRLDGFQGEYNDHTAKHHSPAPESEPKREPEPEPEERHWYYRRVGGRKA